MRYTENSSLSLRGFFLMVVMSLIGSISCSAHQGLHANRCKMTYYNKGTAHAIDKQYHQRILDIINDLVSGATDNPRIMVIDETIKRAKESDCLEIEFADKVEYRVADGHTLSLERILIPLTDGEQQQKPSVSFYWGRKTYISPPYRNVQGDSLIRQLVGILRDTLSKH